MTPVELVHELWHDHTEPCCPYLRHNEDGCYCRSPRLPAGGDPYILCDYASLQTWCTDAQNYTRCHFWPAGDVG
jgi:hypothetical protein